jgi:hypothetical protein
MPVERRIDGIGHIASQHLGSLGRDIEQWLLWRIWHENLFAKVAVDLSDSSQDRVGTVATLIIGHTQGQDK